jgi:Mce-associated membrane protein
MTPTQLQDAGRTTGAPRPGRRRVAGERKRPRLAEPVEQPDEQPDEQPVESTSERGRRVPGWLLVALSALLAVVVAALAVVVTLDRRAAAVDRATADATSAGRAAAVRLLSYDHRHLDADFAAGKALTTAPFSAQYARTTSQAVKKVATDTKATVTADVASVGVEQASSDRVVLVLFVNQTTTSTRLQRPQVDQNRVEMTLVPRGGRWLVSQVSGL